MGRVVVGRLKRRFTWVMVYHVQDQVSVLVHIIYMRIHGAA